MSVTLDGQNLFDLQQLEVETASTRRDSIERIVSGLDGVLSIDIGQRSRSIKQKGVLRAKSKSQMNDRIDAISTYMDGNTHTLAIDNDEKLGDLRMDIFKVSKVRTSGNSVAVDYEILYTQLV